MSEISFLSVVVATTGDEIASDFYAVIVDEAAGE